MSSHRTHEMTGSGWRETCHVLPGSSTASEAGDSTVAILSTPSSPALESGVGVLILSGGDQARAGAHRMFVHMARHMATCGATTLRFDWPGLGDAGGAPASFEDLSQAIARMVQALRALNPRVQRIVLLGLCDGASAALMAVQPRQIADVHGLVLLNPWARSATSLAQSHLKHYYRQRLADPAFWRKLLGGGIRWQAWRDLGRNVAQAQAPQAQGFQDRMAAGWLGFDGPILLITGDRDVTGNEFLTLMGKHPAWRRAGQHPQLTRVTLAESDHTFSSQPAQAALLQQLQTWLQASFTTR